MDSLKNLPSFKKVKSTTRIEIEAQGLDNLVGAFQSERKSLLVPPLFGEYSVWVNFNGGFRDVLYVKYETPELLHILHFLDDKKYQLVTVDFNTYREENNFDLNVTPLSAKYTALLPEEKAKQSRMVLFGVLAISDYMLHYRRDVEYNVLPVHSARRDKSKSRVPNRHEIILSSKKRLYRISGSEKPQKINYHTMAWFVRGHYRRVGPHKVMRYIRPTIARRHVGNPNSQPNSQKYKIIP